MPPPPPTLDEIRSIVAHCPRCACANYSIGDARGDLQVQCAECGEDVLAAYRELRRPRHAEALSTALMLAVFAAVLGVSAALALMGRH